MSVYLDWASTALPDKSIAESVYEKTLTITGNPSSLHREGIAAAQLLKKSRERCAELLGVDAQTVVFTSGGTESNNTAVFSSRCRKNRGTLVTSKIEHPSVSEPFRVMEESGWKVIKTDPGTDGIIKPEAVYNSLTEDTVLVSIMHVNNETGAVQPLEEIGEALKRYSRKHK